MALYTQEQLEKANNIDLEDFLARRGAKLRRTGKESRFYYSDSGGVTRQRFHFRQSLVRP